MEGRALCLLKDLISAQDDILVDYLAGLERLESLGGLGADFPILSWNL